MMAAHMSPTTLMCWRGQLLCSGCKDVRQPVHQRVARTEVCACSSCVDLRFSRVPLRQANPARKA